MRETVAVLILIALLAASCSGPADVVVQLPKEGNEPFRIDKGGDKGILLLHGLTATPWEVRPLADHIARLNISVSAPLMAGHGLSPAELSRTKWEDWYASANDSFTEMSKQVRRVYVGGVSTGAALSLLLAAEHDVEGIVLLAPPIELQDGRAKYAKYYKYLLPYVESSLSTIETGHYYPYHSGYAVAELMELIEVAKKRLPDVTEPLLLLQSIDDKTVKPTSASYVFYNVGSKDKEFRLYGNASHILVQEEDAPSVIFSSVEEFLIKH